MTTNNKHLVDSGREFAASIDINTVIIDIVRKMAELTGKASDWSPACHYVGAHFDETIEFPSPVESTAG